MEHGHRGKGCAVARAAAIFVSASVMVLAGAAAAQQKPAAGPAAGPAAPSDAAKKAAAADAGKKAYEAGAKSFANGKYDPAIAQLTDALRVGGLPATDMAKAMYLRGLAYKKQNKPGLAISDLTSALWLKNGLSDADRQSATAERAEAYRQAGLGDGASVADAYASPVRKPPAAPAPAPVAAAAEPTSPTLTLVDPAAPPPVTRQDPNSEAAREAAEARRLASAPVEESASFVSTAPATTVATAAPAPTSPSMGYVQSPSDAPSLAALPQDAASQPTTSPGIAVPNSVTSFFSNLFGGGSSGQAVAPEPAVAAASEPQVASAPVTTASTSPLDQGATATSGWQQAAIVTPTTPAASPSVAAPALTAQPASPPAPQKQAKSAPKGKYKLHIAAVRSRAEAEMLAQKLAAAHQAELASRAPTVDEAVIGSMGTFYRVRVGGYQNPDEPRGVCNKLRTSGFDCLVVTN